MGGVIRVVAVRGATVGTVGIMRGAVVGSMVAVRIS